ncbi:hypothetical protein [Tsukamurella sp. PLM1]|uniref:hypothetical protein n=1 Tax=Tsukamurella sp. PLM1 TaxID=2929795 RepID=UPI002055C3AF|nr:hypothetical protein [Tsukamurella sp. PLM1]BDH56722.1 hypothetical protein MTP03_16610 [Tsukamurella sp. PLM1]
MFVSVTPGFGGGTTVAEVVSAVVVGGAVLLGVLDGAVVVVSVTVTVFVADEVTVATDVGPTRPLAGVGSFGVLGMTSMLSTSARAAPGPATFQEVKRHNSIAPTTAMAAPGAGPRYGR